MLSRRKTVDKGFGNKLHRATNRLNSKIVSRKTSRCRRMRRRRR
jgi:hypothetical protein